MNFPFGTAEHPITINLYALIKCLMNKIKKRAMCWKKILQAISGGNGGSGLPEFTKNTISQIVVNDYPGTANDLRGCLNDADDFKAAILAKWPHYKFRTFKDTEATKARFKEEIKGNVSMVEVGDLFLSIMDCCFSESNTRNPGNPLMVAGRFAPNPELPPRRVIKSRVLRGTKAGNYLAISACLDHQTAADAVFNRRYNGALTYCLIENLKRGITYRQWVDATNASLRKYKFEQVATLEGPDELKDRMIFEGNVNCIQDSSHGSYTYDRDGDETDGQDEMVYLVDGGVVDDEVNAIIATNPVLV